MEDSSAILIDETYEFSAPRFFDFINGETEEETRNAELWFESTISYAPSPFMGKIKTERNVQIDTLCDFSQADQLTKPQISESAESTSSSLKMAEESTLKSDENPPRQPPAVTAAAVEQNMNPIVTSKEESNNVVNEVVGTKSVELNGGVSAENSRAAQEVNADSTATIEANANVCTPKPRIISPKGYLAAQRSKKPHTAKKPATSSAKNPSLLSRSKTSTSLKSDTKTSKKCGETSNLLQGNQAIKRQKLDGGKTRQILNLKPPNLTHKSQLCATIGRSICSSMDRGHGRSICSSMDRGQRKIYVHEPAAAAPFVSMAEMMKKFESSTRELSLHKSSALDDGSIVQQGKSKLTLTRPKEPDFETAQRIRPTRVKSSTEIEEEIMASMPKFKARPFNKKIFEAPTLPPHEKSTPQPPEFQEFHLETMARASKNAENSSVVSTESSCQSTKWKAHRLTEPRTPVLQTSLRARPITVKSSIEIEQEELEKAPKFRARPLNKKIFESKGDLGLFCNTKKQVTIPQEFHFAIDERIPPPAQVTDLFGKLSIGSESNYDHQTRRNTRPNPFHLHTEERGMEKERSLWMELMQKKIEEEKARIPKANPYPFTTNYPAIPPKPEPKPCTRPEPFPLESLVRHEEEMQREMEERRRKEIEEARMRAFKARPILKEDPMPVPEKERMPLTQVQEFNLHLENRCLDRAEFDKKMKEKEVMYKRYREEAEAAKMMEEEKALKQLRRTLVPHARPVPTFANPFVPQKSCRETTKAKSPKLRIRQRKERQDSVGGAAETAACPSNSAAAHVMR